MLLLHYTVTIYQLLHPIKLFLEVRLIIPLKEQNFFMTTDALAFPPGAIHHGEGRVTFALYAPGKHSVHLVGEFNGWDRSAIL